MAELRSPRWDYRAAIDYLNSFIDFERIPEPRLRTYPEDIDRFRALLARLGDPHRQYKTIHVVGTKGKGSTSAILASILRRAGYKVGLYTSPHLVSVRERIAVNGRIIGKREFARLMGIIRARFNEHHDAETVAFRTVFEHLTATAFLAFAEAKVDIAIIEAGLGAKLDSTIVVDPILTIVTPIGLDHTIALGNTVTLIAEDKAHAIKPGVTVVSSPQSQEAREKLMARAKAVGAPLIFAPGANEFDVKSASLSGSQVSCIRADPSGKVMQLALAGRFQLENLSTVLTAIEELRKTNLTIGVNAVRQGADAVRWPGRLQKVGTRPTIILDGAHNALGIEALITALRELLPKQKPVVVFSAITGKPVKEMLNILRGYAKEVILTPLRFPKSISKAGLIAAASEAGVRAVMCDSVGDAIEKACVLGRENGVVLVTGSLYLVGETMRYLKHLPPPSMDGGIDSAV
jgi:dihydrofolate synthase / folylpolyglutamate synthase